MLGVAEEGVRALPLLLLCCLLPRSSAVRENFFELDCMLEKMSPAREG